MKLVKTKTMGLLKANLPTTRPAKHMFNVVSKPSVLGKKDFKPLFDSSGRGSNLSARLMHE
jgi:hypothetical protein